jgi:hypothetical protein
LRRSTSASRPAEFAPARRRRVQVGRSASRCRDAGPSESISIVDPGRAPPYAVLTGDTLFIGDVGRPDLRASGWSAEELGSTLRLACCRCPTRCSSIRRTAPARQEPRHGLHGRRAAGHALQPTAASSRS